MEQVRFYGEAPYTVAVIHGGPGAPGSMAPVARALAASCGVLEPLQSADTLDGQVEELRSVLDEHAALPVTLIGSSWGAMLSYILAARYGDRVKKLILVGSGGYSRNADTGMATRMLRLSPAERLEVRGLMETLNGDLPGSKDEALARLGQLFTEKTDTFLPLTLDTEILEVCYDVHRRVWSEAAQLRRSGDLLDLGKQIDCPVIAVHGSYDPHPAEDVRISLAAVVKDFRFVLLKNCGHYPWIERDAKARFYAVVREELGTR
jgi:pimeloyl-ACP methyl ester carboxylesterase